MKVLFAASEAYPFFASGGLGDVAGSLPIAIKRRKTDIRVILPLYSDMKPEWREKLTYLTNYTVPLGWRNQYCGLFELKYQGVTYYFLDNEFYFKRQGLYGFYDDGERFAFFSRAILETLFYLDFEPDIIHCNDWQTALVPVYLNLYYRHLEVFSSIKTIFTIHNIQYQGKYSFDILEETIGIGKENAHILEYGNCVNYMKGAIETADKITTVSPTYAREILDPWYGDGLEELLQQKQYKLCGILNGIDTTVYDPAKDKNLVANYDKKTVEKGKPKCKQEIREIFNLVENDSPIIGMVTRLVNHKGLDLVRHVAESLVQSGFQFVLLGNGEYEYENFFSSLSEKYPDMVGVHIGFVPELARKIYAGADMFLMPSKSEPCGLAQMVALRYGTVPIVRETGGLQDTITDSGDGAGNGFTFSSYNAYDMQNACERAKQGYEIKAGWKKLIERDMSCDNSWGVSAHSYIGLYKEVESLW